MKKLVLFFVSWMFIFSVIAADRVIILTISEADDRHFVESMCWRNGNNQVDEEDVKIYSDSDWANMVVEMMVERVMNGKKKKDAKDECDTYENSVILSAIDDGKEYAGEGDL